MPTTSNRGEMGVKSIRLHGMRIEELPLGLGNQAKAGIPLALDNERLQEIDNVIASYPRVTVEYLEARVTESQTSMQDFIRTKQETKQKIAEYRALIQQCEGKKSLRDLEPEIQAVQKRDDLDLAGKVAAIKALKVGTSQYDAAQLTQQITQFEEGIERLDNAIQAENDSIAKLRETKGMIAIRDLQLKRLGVQRIE